MGSPAGHNRLAADIPEAVAHILVAADIPEAVAHILVAEDIPEAVAHIRAAADILEAVAHIRAAADIPEAVAHIRVAALAREAAHSLAGGDTPAAGIRAARLAVDTPAGAGGQEARHTRAPAARSAVLAARSDVPAPAARPEAASRVDLADRAHRSFRSNSP